MNAGTSLAAGTKVVMTKGYQGIQGVIAFRIDSKFDLYVVTLSTGMKVVAGPGAFVEGKP
jgi:hypothetical protein